MHTRVKRAGRLLVSVDIEDWPQSTWDRSLEITARSVRNTELVLEILAEHHQKVTMFVLGKFAEKFPETVKQIAREGHEVASHGYGHIEIFRQTPAQFREDAQRAKSLLEDLIGQRVIGYRAPDFSILSDTIWALDILAELGFQYDSSIFPIKETRYGIGEWPTHPVCVRLPSGRSIIELPIATLNLLGQQLPVAGGGYHRLLPWVVIRYVIARSSRRGETFTTYCHPYEFDSAEFATLGLNIPLKVRLHQGVGRKGFRLKFERMLATFRVVQAYEIAGDPQVPDYILSARLSENGSGVGKKLGWQLF